MFFIFFRNESSSFYPMRKRKLARFKISMYYRMVNVMFLTQIQTKTTLALVGNDNFNWHTHYCLAFGVYIPCNLEPNCQSGGWLSWDDGTQETGRRCRYCQIPGMWTPWLIRIISSLHSFMNWASRVLYPLVVPCNCFPWDQNSYEWCSRWEFTTDAFGFVSKKFFKSYCGMNNLTYFVWIFQECCICLWTQI